MVSNQKSVFQSGNLENCLLFLLGMQREEELEVSLNEIFHLLFQLIHLKSQQGEQPVNQKIRQILKIFF